MATFVENFRVDGLKSQKQGGVLLMSPSENLQLGKEKTTQRSSKVYPAYCGKGKVPIVQAVLLGLFGVAAAFIVGLFFALAAVLLIVIAVNTVTFIDMGLVNMIPFATGLAYVGYWLFTSLVDFTYRNPLAKKTSSRLLLSTVSGVSLLISMFGSIGVAFYGLLLLEKYGMDNISGQMESIGLTLLLGFAGGLLAIIMLKSPRCKECRRVLDAKTYSVAVQKIKRIIDGIPTEQHVGLKEILSEEDSQDQEKKVVDILYCKHCRESYIDVSEMGTPNGYGFAKKQLIVSSKINFDEVEDVVAPMNK